MIKKKRIKSQKNKLVSTTDNLLFNKKRLNKPLFFNYKINEKKFFFILLIGTINLIKKMLILKKDKS